MNTVPVTRNILNELTQIWQIKSEWSEQLQLEHNKIFTERDRTEK